FLALQGPLDERHRPRQARPHRRGDGVARLPQPTGRLRRHLVQGRRPPRLVGQPDRRPDRQLLPLRPDLPDVRHRPHVRPAADVSGSAQHDQPLKVTYDDSLDVEYDDVKLNELIADQFYNTWTGLSCEVTKSDGWCNNLTGLSLKLFDTIHGTQHTLAYQNWK